MEFCQVFLDDEDELCHKWGLQRENSGRILKITNKDISSIGQFVRITSSIRSEILDHLKRYKIFIIHIKGCKEKR